MPLKDRCTGGEGRNNPQKRVKTLVAKADNMAPTSAFGATCAMSVEKESAIIVKPTKEPANMKKCKPSVRKPTRK